MIVWLPESEAIAKPAPFLTPKITSSPSRRSPLTVNDGDETTSFDWWPKKRVDRVDRVRFSKSQPPSPSSDLYWFDDTAHRTLGPAIRPVPYAPAYGGRNSGTKRKPHIDEREIELLLISQIPMGQESDCFYYGGQNGRE